MAGNEKNELIFFAEKQKPTIWTARSVYFVENEEDIDIFLVDKNCVPKNVGNKDLILKTLNEYEGDGWAEYINDSLFYNDDTDNNGLPIPQDTWVTLPINGDSGNVSQITSGLTDLFDEGEIISKNLNDYFLMRLDFKLKTTLANRKGEVRFLIPNIGASFNNQKFTGSDNATDIERVFIVLPFYTGFVDPTRAVIQIKLDNGDGILYGVGAQVKKMHNGKNI